MKFSTVMAAAVLALLLPIHGMAAQAEMDRIRQFESSLLPAFNVEGEPELRWTLQERMAHWKVPGLSIAVIRAGKLAWAKGYGVLQAGASAKVDTDTVFSVASVSKVGAAAITLRLVDSGVLDLDRDVNTFISRWKVPRSIHTEIRPVTLRGILSHTAGLSVHGFPDYQPSESLPKLTDILQGQAPAKNKPVLVEYVPGSKYSYSGGGTTLQQLVIEEVTGLSFAQAARQLVLDPLGMMRSTYQNPIPQSHGNIAKAHGPDGRARALPRGYETMPEAAASGLWTTPTDFANLAIALIESYRGRSGSFISQGLARQMLTEVWPSSRGLGPSLDGAGLDRRFFHGGSNDSYKARIEAHPNTGNGVVVMTNGANGSRLIAEVTRSVAMAEGWSPALSNYQRVRPMPLTAHELQEFVGIYAEEKEGGMKRRVAYKEGILYSSESLEGDGTKLIPVDPSRFVLDAGRLEHVRFLRGYDGRVVGMQRGETVLALQPGNAHPAYRYAPGPRQTSSPRR